MADQEATLNRAAKVCAARAFQEVACQPCPCCAPWPHPAAARGGSKEPTRLPPADRPQAMQAHTAPRQRSGGEAGEDATGGGGEDAHPTYQELMHAHVQVTQPGPTPYSYSTMGSSFGSSLPQHSSTVLMLSAQFHPFASLLSGLWWPPLVRTQAMFKNVSASRAAAEQALLASALPPGWVIAGLLAMAAMFAAGLVS
jgi:hypothetical protein